MSQHTRATLPWRLLLRALPVALRREHGEEILAVALDRLRSERRRHGMPGWLRMAGATAWDFVRTAMRAHRGGKRRLRRPEPSSPTSRWTPDMLLQDLEYGLRGLLHRPAFSATVILTLAIGIGANSLIYSTVDTVIFNPFDLPEPDRVLAVGTAYPRLGQDLEFFEALSAHEYSDIREQARTLEAVAGFDLGNRQLMGTDMPENVRTAFWWDDPLPVFGLRPVLGRSFSPDDLRERSAVAMVSEPLWRTRFAGDESVVGGPIRINDDPYVLIGVFPSSANVYGAEMWTPMWAAPLDLPRGRRQFNVLARRNDETSLSEVNAELEGIARRTEGEYGDELPEYAGWSLHALTWTESQVRTMKPAAYVLMGSVGFVLLLVCANVASLLLSRATGRRREMAVRAALGAGRGRLIRQVLSEALLVACLGAVVGLGLAWLGLQWLEANAPGMLRFLTSRPLALNVNALAYTGLVTVVAGILFGLAPALTTSRFDLRRGLAASAASSTGGRGRRRLHDALVAVEVALALVLLTGAGLFITSLWRLQHIDLGIDPDGVLTMRLTLPGSRYQGSDITRFFEQLQGRVEAVPGVSGVAVASQLPPRGFIRQQFSFPEQVVDSDSELPVALLTIVSQEYHPAMGIPVLAGRAFTDADRVDSVPVAVVNETFARRYLGRDPVGRRVKLGRPDEPLPELEVVGVVQDTRNVGLQTPVAPEIYVSIRQADGASNQLFLLVRSDGDPRALLPSVRRAVASLDPEQPVYSIATLREVMASGYTLQAFAMALLTAFACVALLLAATGIFGVVAYAVSQRSREIGVRIALGAGQGRVRQLVVRQALVPIGFGALAGLLLSIGLGTALAGVLGEVSAFEPLPLAAVAATLVVVALAASYVPARRASAIDPVTALRAE